MDIDKILEKISDRVGKDRKYLKGIFNKQKAELIESFGDSLDVSHVDRLSLIRVGKHYHMDKAQIDEFINMNPDSELKMEDLDYKEIDEVIDSIDKDPRDDDYYEDNVAEIMDSVNPIEGGYKEIDLETDEDWKNYFADIPDPVSVNTEDYEKKPSLNIEIGPTYYLKLTDPKKRPHSHEFDGTFGPYTKHAFDVMLVKISDEDLYDEVYDYGDFKGQKAFVDGQKYTLWLDDKAAGMFKMFWKKHTDSGMPDGREFTFKKTKPGKYNIWTFKNIKR